VGSHPSRDAAHLAVEPQDQSERAGDPEAPQDFAKRDNRLPEQWVQGLPSPFQPGDRKLDGDGKMPRWTYNA
jgi:hypothetical protein